MDVRWLPLKIWKWRSCAYFLGLLIGQGALLLVVSNWSKTLVARLGSQGQRLGAGIWMGIGMAFAWVALID